MVLFTVIGQIMATDPTVVKLSQSTHWSLVVVEAFRSFEIVRVITVNVVTIVVEVANRQQNRHCHQHQQEVRTTDNSQPLHPRSRSLTSVAIKSPYMTSDTRFHGSHHAGKITATQ